MVIGSVADLPAGTRTLDGIEIETPLGAVTEVFQFVGVESVLVSVRSRVTAPAITGT
jgi:hypothetical protein